MKIILFLQKLSIYVSVRCLCSCSYVNDQCVRSLLIWCPYIQQKIILTLAAPKAWKTISHALTLLRHLDLLNLKFWTDFFMPVGILRLIQKPVLLFKPNLNFSCSWQIKQTILAYKRLSNVKFSSTSLKICFHSLNNLEVIKRWQSCKPRALSKPVKVN